MNRGYGGYGEYVPVAMRKANADRVAAEIAAEQGRKPEPLKVSGRKLATTFWGNAWCEHVECYSDYASRLPRGRTYLRNGSVADFFVQPGCVEAVVAGSNTYHVTINVRKLEAKKWKALCDSCSGEITSLIDLLAGEFSDGVMQILSDRKTGLFPSPKEIQIQCTCPDGAWLCKHAAAVLYGVGAKLDTDQTLLFILRAVEHNELVSEAVSAKNLDKALKGDAESLGDADLSDIFGIELSSLADLNIGVDVPNSSGKKKTAKKRSRKQATKKISAAKKKTPAKKKASKKAPTKKKAAKKIATGRAARRKAAKTKAAKKTPAEKKNKRK